MSMTAQAHVEQPPVVFSAEDHDRLLHLAKAALAHYPSNDARFLLDELSRGDILPTEWLPSEVIAMNSFVEFQDHRSEKRRRVQLVYPYQANLSRGRVSVLSPIGAALIGLTEGQSISWLTPGGRHGRITVLRVSRMPFAD